MKKFVLCDSTVATALPTLLLLLRSSTMRSAVRTDYYSQSFATFSTQVKFEGNPWIIPCRLLFIFFKSWTLIQALQNMGVDTKNTNMEVSLEIIGILKRTLSQPANVKIILYRWDIGLSVIIIIIHMKGTWSPKYAYAWFRLVKLKFCFFKCDQNASTFFIALNFRFNLTLFYFDFKLSYSA